ncbi:unnamed protein product [Spirodela intermedia]|uniref:Uncharacterized protein n=1 Tax=Spirodela intermedia TaxID=51605 RepID=A0ABN7EBC3_SPIIN|nr:unnamed protein product [Spirodela intermedia]CAA6675275.1 unnamed protein product [Spirodela intermedia]
MMSHTLHVYSSFLDFSHCSLFFFEINDFSSQVL